MRKIKLLHLQLLPLLSGVQNVSLDILTGLDPDKYEITMASKAGGPLVSKVKELGFKHVEVKHLVRDLSILDLWAFFELLSIFKKGKYDIVHTHSSKTGLLGRIAARLAGVPKVIHTVHGFSFKPEQPLVVRLFYIIMEFIGARFCDEMVFVNKQDRDFALKYGISSKEKSRTIYNGINVAKLENSEYPTPELISFKAFKQENDYVIGSVQRLCKQKNSLQTIKTAINLCNKNPHIKFIIIGEGEYFTECVDLVRKNSLQERIFLPGWQLNVKAWLKEMDLFLIFSLNEGLSIAILEAMACGLPIVASKVTGNVELVEDGVNGYLVSLLDLEKLEEILLEMSEDRGKGELMGKEALRIQASSFTYESFINQYRKLYD